jgi:hypothetical protein
MSNKFINFISLAFTTGVIFVALPSSDQKPAVGSDADLTPEEKVRFLQQELYDVRQKGTHFWIFDNTNTQESAVFEKHYKTFKANFPDSEISIDRTWNELIVDRKRINYMEQPKNPEETKKGIHLNLGKPGP